MGKDARAVHSLPPIPEEEEHEEGDGSNEDQVGPGLDEAESKAMYLFSALVLMLNGLKEGGAVNDKNSKSAVVIRKVYSRVPETPLRVSVTINNVLWRPHLPVISEGDEVDDTDNNSTGNEDEKVSKEFLVDTVSGSAALHASSTVRFTELPLRLTIMHLNANQTSHDALHDCSASEDVNLEKNT
jgi:hypothetical protein